MRIKYFLLGEVALLLAAMSVTQAAEQVDLSTAAKLAPDQLISEVLSANPSLSEIKEAALAVAARVEPAGALDDPVLGYNIAPATIGVREFDAGQRIEISQALPWPGKLNAREQSAREQARAAGAATELQRLNVIAAAKANFAEWHFVHQAMRFNEENQLLIQDLIPIAESRYAAGRGLEQDILQAEVEFALLEDQFITLEGQRIAIQARLNALMNRSPDTRIPPPADISGFPSLPSLPILIEAARLQHPELQQLKNIIAARSADLSFARKEFYPDFRLSAGYNSLWDAEQKRFTVGVSVNIPFNQSRRRSEVSAAYAVQKGAEWRLVDRRAELFSELARARAAVERSVKSVALHREKLLRLAQNSLNVAISDYQSGVGDFLNVLTAERNKLRTEQSLARALADHYRQLAELERALGGSLEDLARDTKPNAAAKEGQQYEVQND